MKTINHTYRYDYRDRGSKFIALLFPCEDETHFTEQLNVLKQEYYDASHHCYAYRINPHQIKEFSSDDGEPGGTAGLPILNQLKSFRVVNAGLVVIRYFGGTKLGKSGLIEAYGSSAANCLKEAKLQEIIWVQRYQLDYPYTRENEILRLVQNHDLIELEANYLARVSKEMACRISKAEIFEQAAEALAHLDISYEKLDQDFIPAP